MADTNAPPLTIDPGEPVAPAPAAAADNPWLSFPLAVALAAGAVAAALLGAAVLPLAGAAGLVIVAALAIAYVVNRSLSVIKDAVVDNAPILAYQLRSVWQALPKPVQTVIKWTWLWLLALIVALALARWVRRRRERAQA